MEPKITEHYHGSAPFATITFVFEALDATKAKEILSDLKIDVGTDVYRSTHPKNRCIVRNSMSYHVRENALALVVCYKCEEAEIHMSMVKKDVNGIAAAFQAVLSVFDK